jgi:predicted transcriptional regulator
LDDETGLDRLFFELSSESRLGILRELEANALKMQDVARRLDLTTTDAFRQMQRLGEATLIQKLPDGTYSITPYGRLVLRFSSPLELLQRHREYFLTHDLFCLPYQFLDRLGELSGARLCMDSMENINRAWQMVNVAGEYMWGGGPERPMDAAGQMIYKRALEGIKYRFLFPEQFLPDYTAPGEVQNNVEWRGFSGMPVTILLTEKEAGISFCTLNGKADYAAFVGDDSTFVGWVKDLFIYYWEKGKPA